MKGAQTWEYRDLGFSAGSSLVCVGPWATHVSSLGLGFLICKMETLPHNVAGDTNADGYKHSFYSFRNAV